MQSSKAFFGIISLCFFSFSSLFSQSAPTVGTDYVFRSVKSSDSTKVSILTVRYDAAGAATVTRTEAPSGSEDKQTLHLFGANVDQLTTSPTDSDGVAEVTLQAGAPTFWLISADAPQNPQSLQGGEGIEVFCDCIFGEFTCSVSFLLVRNGLNATCVPNAGCILCKMRVEKITRDKISEGGGLLLQATNVVVN